MNRDLSRRSEGIRFAVILVPLLFFFLPARSVGALDPIAFLEELNRDITGDGVADTIRLLVRAQRIEAVDGSTGAVLWTSRSYPEFAGMPDHTGTIPIPALVDSNGDGLNDLLFSPENDPRRLMVLDRKTGRTLWSYRAGSKVSGLVGSEFVVHRDLVLVADREHAAGGGRTEALIALDLRTGTERWAAAISLAPSRARSTHLNVRRTVASSERVLEFLCAAGGGCPMPLTGLANAGRFLIEGELAFLAGDRTVSAIDLASGKQRWVWTQGEDLADAALLGGGDRVYLVAWPIVGRKAERCLVAALAAESGARLWQREIDLPRPPYLSWEGDVERKSSFSSTTEARVLLRVLASDERLSLLLTPEKAGQRMRSIVLDARSGEDTPAEAR